MKKIIALIVLFSVVSVPKMSFAQEYIVKIDFRNEAFMRQMEDIFKIKKLYISSVDERGWGDEMLNGKVINLGEVKNYRMIDYDTPIFDIKAIIMVDGYYGIECLSYTHYNLNAETEVVDFEKDFNEVKCD